jgi:hypothetical protein
VLETTWQTTTGWMIVQDFLAVGPAKGGARRVDYHRAPADFGAVGALVRIATCISGRVEVRIKAPGRVLPPVMGPRMVGARPGPAGKIRAPRAPGQATSGLRGERAGARRRRR